MTFLHRVTVEDSQGRRLYHAPASHAEILLSTARAIVHACKGVKVAIIRLSEHQSAADIMTMGLRPGSYGIHRETVSGHVVFSHKPHYGNVLQPDQRSAA